MDGRLDFAIGRNMDEVSFDLVEEDAANKERVVVVDPLEDLRVVAEFLDEVAHTARVDQIRQRQEFVPRTSGQLTRQHRTKGNNMIDRSIDISTKESSVFNAS